MSAGWRHAVTTLAAGAIGAGIARAVQGQLKANPPGGRQRWERINYRGGTVTLEAGPAMGLSPEPPASSGCTTTWRALRPARGWAAI